jgi:RNA polymerase sigma-70 factor (ECF subfamily)
VETSKQADDALERLSALLRVERRALIAVARSEGLTAEEALECVQDALCTFLARERAGHNTVPDWALASLRVMVRNAARNFRRLHFRLKPHLAIDPEREADAASQSAEELLARAEAMARLRVCVAELCTIQRSVVMLRLLEERSGEDVAELLGLGRGHVDVLVHRAKAALRICMQAPA